MSDRQVLCAFVPCTPLTYAMERKLVWELFSCVGEGGVIDSRDHVARPEEMKGLYLLLGADGDVEARLQALPKVSPRLLGISASFVVLSVFQACCFFRTSAFLAASSSFPVPFSLARFRLRVLGDAGGKRKSVSTPSGCTQPALQHWFLGPAETHETLQWHRLQRVGRGSLGSMTRLWSAYAVSYRSSLCKQPFKFPEGIGSK